MRFLRDLRVLFWCLRFDWQYAEFRTVRHVVWTWKQIRDDWFTYANFQGAIASSYEDLFDSEHYDPYYDEG